MVFKHNTHQNVNLITNLCLINFTQKAIKAFILTMFLKHLVHKLNIVVIKL